jgi:4-amino-4-deoxy-L-arabinose transferase-like glycosyltransferase
VLFTPVFLVSATTVMCDVWLLALWVWSVDCWLRGLEERHSYWLLLLASLLVAAAALTKYFGVSLVPLLAAYTVARERRLTSRLLFLLIPNAIIGIYEAIAKAKYGQGLFTNAMVYPWQGPVKAGKQLSGQFLTGLSFTGGCLFPALFYAALLKSRKVLISGIAIFLAFLPSFYLWVARELTSRTDVIAVTVEGALFATIVATSTGCTCFPASYSGRLQTGRHRTLRLQVISKSIPGRAGCGVVRRALGLPILYGTLEGEAIGPLGAQDHFG